MMTAVKRSYDNVDKSQEDKRLYRGLELDNGIKVRTMKTLALHCVPRDHALL